MDHYATRYPTNVVDIANFLVRLTGMSWNVNISLDTQKLMAFYSIEAIYSSDYSLLSRRTIH